MGRRRLRAVAHDDEALAGELGGVAEVPDGARGARAKEARGCRRLDRQDARPADGCKGHNASDGRCEPSERQCRRADEATNGGVDELARPVEKVASVVEYVSDDRPDVAHQVEPASLKRVEERLPRRRKRFHRDAELAVEFSSGVLGCVHVRREDGHAVASHLGVLGERHEHWERSSTLQAEVGEERHDLFRLHVLEALCHLVDKLGRLCTPHATNGVLRNAHLSREGLHAICRLTHALSHDLVQVEKDGAGTLGRNRQRSEGTG